MPDTHETLGGVPREEADLIAGLPRYHPRYCTDVWAGKIAHIAVQLSNGAAVLRLELPDGLFIHRGVPRDYMQTHHPEVGGFYVVHLSGHESYLPATVFAADWRAADADEAASIEKELAG